MNRKIFVALRVFLSAVCLVVAALAPVYAVDSNARYFAYGVGQRTCSDYLKFRQKNLDVLDQKYERYTRDELYEIVDKIVEHWIAGFLTAADLYLADTYKIAGETTMDELKARLETICRANDKQYVAAAMAALVEELNPRRVKAEAGK
jgi:hypothetical protein